ncbi:MAG: Mu transposase C-terminal domain-containing protein [Bacteroidetes bacterium]|nr:Mu transposase C-terminal domain-containing protein [Bacteroidota bacterium]
MTVPSSIDLELVPADKLTPDVIRKIDAMTLSISTADNVSELEKSIAASHGLPAGTQRRYKAKLRKIFGLEPRSSFESVLNHPQLRAAIENVVARSERSDKMTLRSAKHLSVVVPTTGECIGLDDLAKSLYSHENVDAEAVYKALVTRTRAGQVVTDDGTPAAIGDLPALSSVVRYLRRVRESEISIRYGRSRKNDFDAKQMPFVTRDPEQYAVNELWFGDHTELDFIIMNEQGKFDRRWITSFIDMRTRLIVGYYLSWQPNSDTIAMAFRNAVLGGQLKAFVMPSSPLEGEGRGEVGEGHYEPVHVNCLPENVTIDNGKDYRSKYTQRVFGKVDFNDQARLSVSRITRLHYTLPYHGMSKAEQERWYGTIQRMVKYLPGYKGNNMRLNKPDSLGEEIKAGQILQVETFDKLVALAVNVYNNKIHRSLKDQSPLIYYLTNQHQNRTIDVRILDFLMNRVEKRPIKRSQVTLLGSEYYSDELFKYNGKRAEIYYDLRDLGVVSIYVDGKFIATAANKDMFGKDARGWVKILKDRRRHERDLKEELQEVRKGITRTDAKYLLLEGKLSTAVAVPEALLSKSTPQVVVMTGIEKEAIEQSKQVKKHKEMVELEETAKAFAKSTKLTIAAVNKIR